MVAKSKPKSKSKNKDQKKSQDLTVQETLLKKLIDARDNGGKTISEIARDSGVSQPILSRWVSGERASISATSLDKLAKYFDLKLQ